MHRISGYCRASERGFWRRRRPDLATLFLPPSFSIHRWMEEGISCANACMCKYTHTRVRYTTLHTLHRLWPAGGRLRGQSLLLYVLEQSSMKWICVWFFLLLDSSRSLCRPFVAHHCCEFFVADFPVSVEIRFSYHFVNLFLGKVLSEG